MFNFLPRNGNLLQNPSFEADLAFWQADNAATVNNSASEGTQAVGLGPGPASLYQDVPLCPWLGRPLLLSFIAYADSADPGNLVAEVLWLDANRAVIGTGLRALVPGDTVSNVRDTFFDTTDQPPHGAFWARLQFSKESGLLLRLDLINLVPVDTPNLIKNPSFEAGLAEWNAAGFDSSFVSVWEGGAAATQTSLGPGILTQDVLLSPLLPGTAYLLVFSAESLQASTVTAQLIWLNVLGNPIGTPGIDIPIVPTTLSGQGKYLSFLQLSGPAPLGAVRARLIFEATGEVGSTLNLDQVILIRLPTPNLIANPGFVNGLDNWTSVNVTAQNTGGYVGQNFVELSSAGAFINQTAALPPLATGRNFLLNFALHFSGVDASNGNVIAQVQWLDALGREIGLGLSLIIAQTAQLANQWQVYTGITDRAPLGAVSARIQFTSSAGVIYGLDSVTFARIS